MPRPIRRPLALAALVALLPQAGLAQTVPAPQPAGSPDATQDYYAEAAATLDRMAAAPIPPRHARNLILFIGDGMGISTLTAARIYEGQSAGHDGESTVTAIDALPYAALVKTYSHDFQVADSAATATALTSGTKTRSGVIGVGPGVVRGDCASGEANRVASLFEQAEDAGRATGVISTARITHATPATVYAHAADRNWENDTQLPAGAACSDIAAQLVAWPHGDGLDLVLGGGRANFLPKTVADPEYPGKTGARGDGRDLVAAWRARFPQGQYVWNQAGFAALDPAAPGPVLGLFEPSHMQYEADRSGDGAGEPALADMVALAIAKLSRNPNGYVLMVEGGRIDHAHHAGNAKRALIDAQALDAAVARAVSLVDPADTMVLVTADHSHVLTIAGYPPRNNPILGLASVDEDGNPIQAKDGKGYTTLGYMTGPGAHADGVRSDPAAEDRDAIDYKQQALVPLEAETHGGEDVAIKATGPGSDLIRGTIEQNLIYHIMRRTLGL